ncbi:ABC transporter ATP-binding protein [Candidatus Woesearchaeota archaeon]|nr:ABC transporter ATP-binding protein [Candidatus Woesearchaeota archaeon]
MDAIEVINLVKSFKEKNRLIKAVDNISFSVKKGEIFGLLGPNGAGKTTTLNILNGLVSKDSGEIRILGVDPEQNEQNWEYIKNKINVSTAYYSLSEQLTIKQNLKVYAMLYNVKNVQEKIDKLLKMFELKELENRKVVQLSSGEKTRVALCKGFLNEPEVLFLDECTVGLDPDIAEKTRKIIKEYQQKNGTTIIFTSHYMYEVEELCDRIAFMKNGKIIKIDTAKNFKKLIKKTSIELTIKENYPAFLKILKEKKIDILSTGTNTIIFEVSSSTDQLYKLMNIIFKAGVKISDMHMNKPTLEDIFIQFARRKQKKSKMSEGK